MLSLEYKHVLDLGFVALDSGFRTYGFGFRVRKFELSLQTVEFRVGG